jgi:two-component system, chemotaxis family, chemotaxis protein CheY
MIRLENNRVMHTKRGTVEREKRIMVVDDSIVVRHVVSLTLRKAGYDVVEAVNGWDALEKLDRSLAKMVITDVSMPKMDGIELIRQIRKSSKYWSMPVLMLTMDSQEGMRREGMKAGATGWVIKPFHAIQLLNKISKYMGPDRNHASCPEG